MTRCNLCYAIFSLRIWIYRKLLRRFYLFRQESELERLRILEYVSAVEGLDHWIREKLGGTGEAHPVTPL